MTIIPAGSFIMGAPDSDRSAPRREKPQHKVNIKKPFAVGMFEITYDAVFDGRRAFNGGPKGHRAVQTEEVGKFKPNRFGVYDMHGNAAEWVSDCWHRSYEGAPNDGSSWDIPAPRRTCNAKVIRGGSWYSSARDLRASYRRQFSRSLRSRQVGFRVARDLN